jgi:hypothetical protein
MKASFRRPSWRLVPIVTAIFGCGASHAADLPLVDGDRIVIAGDSIPDQKMWPHYFASYLILMNPGLRLHVQTCARGGTSIGSYLDSGDPNYEEYHKMVYALQPDYVFIASSTNGGYDKPTHKAKMQDLAANYIIGDSNATPVLLGMAPLSTVTGAAVAGDYDAANEEIALAATPPLRYHKTWTALKDRFTANRIFTADAATDVCTCSGHGFPNGRAVTLEVSVNPAGPGGLASFVVYYVRDATSDTFRLSATPGGAPVDIATNGSGTQRVSDTWPVVRSRITDTDHPGSSGQIAYAWKVITGLGFTTDVSSATIAADAQSVSESHSCTISSVTANGSGGIDFVRRDARLPWAIDESGRAGAELLYPEIKGWQKYMLIVTGLPAADYDIVINGTDVADLSSTTLAAGWNMADLTTGPVHDQIQEVLGRIRDMHWVDRATLLARGTPRQGVELYESYARTYYQSPHNLRGQALIDSLAPALSSIASLDELIHSAAQPQPLSFSIRRKDSAPPPEDPVADPDSPPDAEPPPPEPDPGPQPTQSYSPPAGIPVPTWGGFEPMNAIPPLRPPAWPAAPEPGFYYINNTAPGATDTDNPYGYPAKPRLTIPQTPYAAGSRMEIHGGPYTHPGGDADLDLTFAGTQASPCWVIGDAAGTLTEIRGAIKIAGSYAIIQGINNTYDSANSRANGIMIGGDPKLADHICLRSCVLEGDGLHHPGFGTNLYIAGTSAAAETNHIVIFDVESRDADSYEYVKTVAEDDQHGALVGLYTNNVWFLKFKSHNNAGDGMQVSGNNALGEARVQRLFIGDSEFFHNGENSGIDMKSSLDVIISHNRIYDCIESKGGGGGSLCVTQDEGGDGCDNIWIIFNEMHDAVNPLRVEGKSSNIHLLGNVIRDMMDQVIPANSIEDGFSGFVTRSSNLCTVKVIDNTFVRMMSTGVRWKSVGTPPQLHVHGNIFALRTNPSGWDVWGVGQDPGVTLDYTLYDAASPRMYFGTTYTSLSAWKSNNPRGWDAHSRAGSPGFTDVAIHNYKLSSGSDAIDASVEDPAYAAFESRYGLNIRRDFSGIPRPQGQRWDIGAYEFPGPRPLRSPRVRVREQ